MMMCGSSTASGLQARYAAVRPRRIPRPPAGRCHWWCGRRPSGQCSAQASPLPAPTSGETLGMNGLAGPYLISMVAFALATLTASTLTKTSSPPRAPQGTSTDTEAAAVRQPMKLGEALRFALARPVPLFAMVTIIAGQMMMTNVMVMTPVHMDHQQFEPRRDRHRGEHPHRRHVRPFTRLRLDGRPVGFRHRHRRRGGHLHAHDRPRCHRRHRSGVVDGPPQHSAVAARHRLVDVPHRRDRRC